MASQKVLEERGWAGVDQLRSSLSVLALALVVVGCWFFLQYRIGLDLADEGYLWYGVQRTMLGEVPVRDFLSYDPGRYYWSALLMPYLGGDGILSLRASVALFQILGAVAWIGVLARGYRGRSLLFWSAALVCFAIWMFPRHKLFDTSISLIVLGSLSVHLEQPSKRRMFLSGCVVGLASFFGRNHAVYALAANLLSIAWLLLPHPFSREKIVSLGFPICAWIMGFVAGCVPLLCFLVFVPGFAEAYVEYLRMTLDFAAYATNLLPLPNPLALTQVKATMPEKLREMLWYGFLYGSLLASVIACTWMLWVKAKGKNASSLMAASAFTALPFAHIVYYWPDRSHLAQSIFPILLLAFLALGELPRRLSTVFAVALCCASLIVMLPNQPAVQAYGNNSWEQADIAGEKILVPPSVSGLLREVDRLIEQYAPGGRRFLAAPSLPGLYAVYRRKSPMFDIYPLVPKPLEKQAWEIELIRDADIGFAVLVNFRLAGRADFVFSQTNPLINAFVQDHFNRLDDVQYPRQLSVFVAR